LGIKIQSSIIFLGTGQGSFVVGKQIRSSAGFILQSGENQFHIDPGPSALAKAAEYGVNIRANTAIFVSHSHINHSNDINAVIDAMTYSGFDKKGVLIANSTVVNGSEELRPVLSGYYRDFLERFIVMQPNQRVALNEIEILTLKTLHSEQNTLGFKFFTPEFVLTYSSDTSYSPELVKQYKNSNILILNVPYLKRGKYNLCVEDAIKIIKEVNPRLAIIQHFGVEMTKADPLYQIREIQKATKVQTVAAKDGMVINPLSYSVDRGQRTLYSFPKNQVRGNKEEEMKDRKHDGGPGESLLDSDKVLMDLIEEGKTKQN